MKEGAMQGWIKRIVMSVLTVASLADTSWAEMPKYVFFFIGDGMSTAQIQATEAYLTVKNGGKATEAKDLLKEKNRLNMTKLPVFGMQTTYDTHALMTDSASAGTAMACGVKTASGVIGMNDTKTINYKSIAQLAAEKGKRIGIVSSVSLEHATPASFYASVPSRGETNTIASQLADTGYDFFGGGGFNASAVPINFWSKLAQNGYTVINEREALLDLKKNPKSKVVAINPTLQDSKAMPYAIDRPQGNLSLAEMTEVAVASLIALKKDDYKGGWFHRDEGFFLMVEGGKIDWACHANDAMATIGDTLDFDDAIGVALAFYRAHPDQTLIVVTGDHETGGMSVGHATTGYSAYYERLLGQTMSFTAFGMSKEWAAIKAKYASSYTNTDNNLASDSDMLVLMEKGFGLILDENPATCQSDTRKICLNSFQKIRLEEAFDKSIQGYDKSDPENRILYGGYEPIAVTMTHILNEAASIGWTSYSHTGVPVPVFAIGADAKRFAGLYDNTDIAKKMAKAMGIWQPLPVVKTTAVQ
jgi:alkaline phosphatase